MAVFVGGEEFATYSYFYLGNAISAAFTTQQDLFHDTFYPIS